MLWVDKLFLLEIIDVILLFILVRVGFLVVFYFLVKSRELIKICM